MRSGWRTARSAPTATARASPVIAPALSSTSAQPSVTIRRRSRFSWSSARFTAVRPPRFPSSASASTAQGLELGRDVRARRRAHPLLDLPDPPAGRPGAGQGGQRRSRRRSRASRASKGPPAATAARHGAGRNGTGRQRERMVGSRSAGWSVTSRMCEWGAGSSSVFSRRGAPSCSRSRSAPCTIITRRRITLGRLAIWVSASSRSRSRICCPTASTSVRSRASAVWRCAPSGSISSQATSARRPRACPCRRGPKSRSCCGGVSRARAARRMRSASGWPGIGDHASAPTASITRGVDLLDRALAGHQPHPLGEPAGQLAGSRRPRAAGTRRPRPRCGRGSRSAGRRPPPTGTSITTERSGRHPSTAGRLISSTSVDAHAAGRALVGERGVEEAVGDHPAAGRRAPAGPPAPPARPGRRRRGCASATGVRAPGSPESRISRTRSPRGVPPGSRVARHGQPARLEGLGQQPRLGALAAAVDPLQGDEAARHSEPDPHGGDRDPRDQREADGPPHPARPARWACAAARAPPPGAPAGRTRGRGPVRVGGSPPHPWFLVARDLLGNADDRFKSSPTSVER